MSLKKDEQMMTTYSLNDIRRNKLGAIREVRE